MAKKTKNTLLLIGAGAALYFLYKKMTAPKPRLVPPPPQLVLTTGGGTNAEVVTTGSGSSNVAGLGAASYVCAPGTNQWKQDKNGQWVWVPCRAVRTDQIF